MSQTNAFDSLTKEDGVGNTNNVTKIKLTKFYFKNDQMDAIDKIEFDKIYKFYFTANNKAYDYIKKHATAGTKTAFYKVYFGKTASFNTDAEEDLAVTVKYNLDNGSYSTTWADSSYKIIYGKDYSNKSDALYNWLRCAIENTEQIEVENALSKYYTYEGINELINNCELPEERFGTACGNNQKLDNYLCNDSSGMRSSLGKLLFTQSPVYTFKDNLPSDTWQETLSYKNYINSDNKVLSTIKKGRAPRDVNLKLIPFTDEEGDLDYKIDFGTFVDFSYSNENQTQVDTVYVVIYKIKDDNNNTLLVVGSGISVDNLTATTYYGIINTAEIGGVSCSVTPAFKNLGYIPESIALLCGGAGGAGGHKEKNSTNTPSGGCGGGIGLFVITFKQDNSACIIELGKRGWYNSTASLRRGDDTNVYDGYYFSSNINKIYTNKKMLCVGGGGGGSNNGNTSSGGSLNQVVNLGDYINISFVCSWIGGGNKQITTEKNEIIKQNKDTTNPKISLLNEITTINSGTTLGKYNRDAGSGGNTIANGGYENDDADDSPAIGRWGSGGGSTTSTANSSYPGGGGWLIIWY